MLLSRSRKVVSRPSLRSAVFATANSRFLSIEAPGSSSSSSHESPQKLSPSTTAVREGVSMPGTSFLLGSASKGSLYVSARSCSGRNVTLGQKRTSLFSRPLPIVFGVRSEATLAEKEAPSPPTVEKFEYQAEVTRLLDLIVHSLYSNKEVFLRELVSNASDALDKLRFLSVTEPELLEGDPNLEIRIRPNENGTITITDTGVGMTREELVRSLGTIAESGTAKFMKALKENKDKSSSDSNLIGQFGVGFYSAFLVADKVSVSTKSAKSDRQYVWEGEADTSVYTIREETDPQKLIPRGTIVTLHLKPDAKDEYSDPVRIENLVKNYSQFISFPIYTYQEKTRSKEVDGEADGSESASEGDTAEKKKKKKAGTEKYWDWELTNNTKPIWLRSPKDITKADYDGFFKSTFNEFLDPIAYSHFSTEGEIEFKSLLYIPGMIPLNGHDHLSENSKNIKLYVKRVFISDEFNGELFPRYLGFVKGVIDSNDLPLNVSREILQESRIVRMMKKRLTKKTFDMISEVAKRENKNDYKIFWMQFGKNLKMGCISDHPNHKSLAPLLRFFSSKTKEDEYCSLDEYVGRMKEGQTSIYYFAADSVKSAKAAPFLEELSRRDLEVLLLVDAIDETTVTNLGSYKDKKFVDISKEDLDIDSENKEKVKEVEQELRPLCDWMKGFLGQKVAKVKVSSRLSSSPCVLVTAKSGWSANMERIMKAQAFGDVSQLDYMRAKRVLEINPDHPIIKDLNIACKETPRDAKAKQMIELLYESAQLASGFTPENPAEFSGRVYEMMGLALSSNREHVTQGVGETAAVSSAFPSAYDQREEDFEDDYIEGPVDDVADFDAQDNDDYDPQVSDDELKGDFSEVKAEGGPEKQ